MRDRRREGCQTDHVIAIYDAYDTYPELSGYKSILVSVDRIVVIFYHEVVGMALTLIIGAEVVHTPYFAVLIGSSRSFAFALLLASHSSRILYCRIPLKLIVSYILNCLQQE